MIFEAFVTKRPLFIPFVMAGFPSRESFLNAVLSLEKNNAQLIEIGVPFSDPIADGPVNRLAAQEALNNGTTLSSILDDIQTLRARGCKTPLLLFSYFNSILKFGIERFARKCLKVGVQAILIVDLPPEEGKDIFLFFKSVGLEIVLLIAPTTHASRFPLYKALQPSFIYYISRLGVTGIQETVASYLRENVTNLRSYFPQIPIVVGFGISNAEQVKMVTTVADGVVIGSKLVQTLANNFNEFEKVCSEISLELQGHPI